MNTMFFILGLLAISFAKPIYDLKTSYVTHLTPLNFADQVSKYRQNTHYVSIVHFYKSSGISSFIQMENLSTSSLKWISGLTNIGESLE